MNVETIAQEIADDINHNRGRFFGGHSATKERLADEFGRRRGWKRSKARLHRYRMNGASLIIGPLELGERLDHVYLYWIPETRRHAIVSHVYEHQADYPSDAAFAAKHNLIVDYPTDFPSWWYPGRTTLVVWREQETR